MKDVSFEKLFKASALEMLAAFLRSSVGERPDEKGAPREKQLKDFLDNWLPARYGLCKGYLANQAKNLSKECDIIIFNDEKCPKFIFDGNNDLRIVPISYVYGTIEVKSTLDKPSLTDAVSKFSSVDTNYTYYIINRKIIEEWSDIDIKLADITDDIPGNYKKPKSSDYINYKAKIKHEVPLPSKPIKILFAYKTSLELEKIESLLQNSTSQPDIIVILNHGILVKNNELVALRALSLLSNQPSHVLKDSFGMVMYRASQGHRAKNYIGWACEDDSINLMYFYVFLLDLLNDHILIEYFAPSDIIAIWQSN